VIPISQAETGLTQLKDPPNDQTDAVRPLVLVVTNDDSHQQLVDDYLTATGYEMTVVAETAALLAALKARPPYAVLIDRKMGGLTDSLVSSQSDFSDTLIHHKYRSYITPEIPQIIFSDDGQGRLVFSVSDEQGNISKHTSPCLTDAIQQPSQSNGQESRTAPVIEDATTLHDGIRRI
jgi:CheY-like chemotaxis protein